MEKRTARSQVVLDLDDIAILSYISLNSEGRRIGGRTLESLKKEMNMSHKGLLVHLKRLGSLNLIKIYSNEENYKVKIVSTTASGFKIKEEIITAIRLGKEGKYNLLVEKNTFFGKKIKEMIIG